MRRFGAVVAMLALAAACSSSTHTTTAPVASTTTTTTGPACDRPHAPGQSAQSFTFQSQNRTYQLYVPKTYDGTRAVPVVFDFHGYGSSAAAQISYGNFKPLADRDNFLIVAPDGQNPAARHFNLYGEPNLQDDVAMTGALLDHIEATFCVDAKRVFTTGMSDGGATSSVLACRMADRFAAFAPVAAMAGPVLCPKSPPVPFIAFAGTADPVVPFEGGKVSCCGGLPVAAASDTAARWAAHDGCNAAFTEDRVGSEVRRRAWSGCRDGSAVVFYIVDGGGHTWPGSLDVARLGKTTHQIDATALIWDFFQAHPHA